MSEPAPPLSNSQVKEIIANQRAKNLGIRLAPRPRCFNPVTRYGKEQACGNEIYIFSYVLTRPEEGRCRLEEGGCGVEWHDTTTPAPFCQTCGWSQDHREGYGCTPEGPPADADVQPYTGS